MGLLRWQRRQRQELDQAHAQLAEAEAYKCQLEQKVERLEKDTEILIRRIQRELREKGVAC